MFLCNDKHRRHVDYLWCFTRFFTHKLLLSDSQQDISDLGVENVNFCKQSLEQFESQIDRPRCAIRWEKELQGKFIFYTKNNSCQAIFYPLTAKRDLFPHLWKELYELPVKSTSTFSTCCLNCLALKSCVFFYNFNRHLHPVSDWLMSHAAVRRRSWVS